jgi:hypothetical protein
MLWEIAMEVLMSIGMLLIKFMVYREASFGTGLIRCALIINTLSASTHTHLDLNFVSESQVF